MTVGAAHESPCTTKLYDSHPGELSLDEVERIRNLATHTSVC